MARAFAWPLLPILVGLGCSGSAGTQVDVPADVEGPTKPRDPDAALPAARGSCAPATPRRLRRLTHAEHGAVIADLFGERVELLAGFPPEGKSDGFAGDAEGLTVGGTLVDAYARAAEEASRRLPLDRVAPCPEREEALVGGATACAQRFIASFGRRAYGRPLDDEELSQLGSVYVAGAGAGGVETRARYETGVRLVAEAILQSPHFLYRTELGHGAPRADGSVRLAPHEVASELSFLLTGSRPDNRLLDAAARGALASPELVGAEAKRLLALPRAREHLRDFLRAWLEVDDLHRINKAPDIVGFPAALRAEMDQEMRRFLEVSLDGGGRLEALFETTASHVGPQLASQIYTQPGELLEGAGDGNRPVKLDPARRRGVLALSGFLATHASIDRTSPVARGLFVLTKLLCQPVGDPPPGATIAPLDTFDRSLTTRQKAARHSEGPCRGCHQFIDPIGFGFEQMDLLGRLRTEENGQPIDSSGELKQSDVDGPFTGPAQLDARLARSQTVRACFVTQLYRFAEGRTPGTEDECAMADLGRSFARSGATIEQLLLEYVTSESFVTRRADR